MEEDDENREWKNVKKILKNGGLKKMRKIIA